MPKPHLWIITSQTINGVIHAKDSSVVLNQILLQSAKDCGQYQPLQYTLTYTSNFHWKILTYYILGHTNSTYEYYLGLLQIGMQQTFHPVSNKPMFTAALQWHTFHRELLNSSSLSTTAVGRQAESADAPACSNARAQHIIGVQVITALQKQKVLVFK